MTATPTTDHEPLVAALIELEHHIGAAGWDQPPRLFALVTTDDLIASEPDLAASLGLVGTADGGQPDALTPIEQDHFASTGDVLADLAQIVWPEGVFGCAVSLERTFLPAQSEVELPEDATEAAHYVAEHPDRQDIRVVVGVDRAGHRHGVARLVTRPNELLGGQDLVPGLAEALAHTLT